MLVCLSLTSLVSAAKKLDRVEINSMSCAKVIYQFKISVELQGKPRLPITKGCLTEAPESGRELEAAAAARGEAEGEERRPSRRRPEKCGPEAASMAKSMVLASSMAAAAVPRYGRSQISQ